MRLSGQFQASLIYFFLRKDFGRTKTQINQNQPTKTKKSERKTKKENGFSAHKNFQEGRNHLFWVLVFFVHSKFFRKNK